MTRLEWSGKPLSLATNPAWTTGFLTPKASYWHIPGVWKRQDYCLGVQRTWPENAGGGMQKRFTKPMRRCERPCSEMFPPHGRGPGTRFSSQRVGTWHMEPLLHLLLPEILLD